MSKSSQYITAAKDRLTIMSILKQFKELQPRATEARTNWIAGSAVSIPQLQTRCVEAGWQAFETWLGITLMTNGDSIILTKNTECAGFQTLLDQLPPQFLLPDQDDFIKLLRAGWDGAIEFYSRGIPDLLTLRYTHEEVVQKMLDWAFDKLF